MLLRRCTSISESATVDGSFIFRPFQVLYHSEVLPTTAGILYRSFTPKHTGNCR